jgi:hypothetical protein
MNKLLMSKIDYSSFSSPDALAFVFKRHLIFKPPQPYQKTPVLHHFLFDFLTFFFSLDGYQRFHHFFHAILFYKLTLPISNFRPIMNYPNVHKSNKQAISGDVRLRDLSVERPRREVLFDSHELWCASDGA